MMRVAGRRGYQATIVADVLTEAGVSRATFYKHFADKHECFLATYDLAAERALVAIETGCEGERPWAERARRGLGSLLDLFVAEPDLARIVAVEPAVTGARARQLQWATMARAALLLEAARGGAQGPELPANTALMAIGAVASLLFDEIQAGRTAELQQRLPDLLFALLAPYVGPKEAVKQLRGKGGADARRVVARGRAAARSRR